MIFQPDNRHVPLLYSAHSSAQPHVICILSPTNSNPGGESRVINPKSSGSSGRRRDEIEVKGGDHGLGAAVGRERHERSQCSRGEGRPWRRWGNRTATTLPTKVRAAAMALVLLRGTEEQAAPVLHIIWPGQRQPRRLWLRDATRVLAARRPRRQRLLDAARVPAMHSADGLDHDDLDAGGQPAARVRP
jgi:hypothetical protein